MKKLELNHSETKSADVVSENISDLRSLFPDAFREGKIDFDVLKQLLGGAVDDREEKYGLHWHGKRKARQIALTPSVGTLLPCPEESVDWNATQNLVVEGDNLEVLKLLQKSYSGKIKLIYIDPPYNTGSDFVYPDDFSESIKSYLEITGQASGGRKITSNTESSGRYHTEWLNLMYPRLKLARSLLVEDGIIAISIDDTEAANLKLICNDIFGEENFISQIIWKSRVSEDTRAKNGVSTDHEYIICYAKSEGAAFRGAEKDLDKFSNKDSDPRGPWRSADLTGLAGKEARPNLHYDLIDPETGTNYGCPPKGWRYEPATMREKIAEGRILFPSDVGGRPRHKLFLNEMQSLFKNLSSVLTNFSTADGTREVNQLMGGSFPFLFPKPTALVRLLAEQITSGSDIILDFFAGSGTTGHAVMAQNAIDGGSRRFIAVQLPQPLDGGDRDQGAAANYLEKLGKPLSISELTKERLRRAGANAQTTNSKKGDIGFRVFKLAQSNIRTWEPVPSDLAGTLLANAEHIVPGRTEHDILYELLLKLGLDLCVPIETRQIAGKSVHAIGGGALIACLADGLTKDVVESLSAGIVAWWKELAPAVETRVVFKDSGFKDDIAKTNMAAILNQNGILDVRSL